MSDVPTKEARTYLEGNGVYTCVLAPAMRPDVVGLVGGGTHLRSPRCTCRKPRSSHHPPFPAHRMMPYVVCTYSPRLSCFLPAHRHLVETLLTILDEKPVSPLDAFEAVSTSIKAGDDPAVCAPVDESTLVRAKEVTEMIAPTLPEVAEVRPQLLHRCHRLPGSCWACVAHGAASGPFLWHCWPRRADGGVADPWRGGWAG
jgi:hypothetical protein